MKNITNQFNEPYAPIKALLIYEQQQMPQQGYGYSEGNAGIYVESYDIGRHGKPVNAHPLSVKEMNALCQILNAASDHAAGYLKPAGLLPPNLLYLNGGQQGCAVWYTPPHEAPLLFTESTGIPCGTAKIPAMVWKADAEQLAVYALKGKTKPQANTPLYHAPFHNVYCTGSVCMGTVRINTAQCRSLQDMMATWQQNFFGSYFSHSINGSSSTKTDTNHLWRELIGSGKDFPQDELLKTRFTLKNLCA